MFKVKQTPFRAVAVGMGPLQSEFAEGRETGLNSEFTMAGSVDGKFLRGDV